MMEIYKHKYIIKKIKDLIPFLEKKDIQHLENILKKSQNVVDEFNWNNVKVVDITKREEGGWNGGVLRILRSYYRYELNNCSEKIADDFYAAIDEMEWDQHLKESRILLSRQAKTENFNDLQKATNSIIRLEIINEFNKKNKGVITKLCNYYETSK